MAPAFASQRLVDAVDALVGLGAERLDDLLLQVQVVDGAEQVVARLLNGALRPRQAGLMTTASSRSSTQQGIGPCTTPEVAA